MTVEKPSETKPELTRKEFEEWVVGYYFKIDHSDLTRDAVNGTYDWTPAEHAWSAWQSARRQTLQEVIDKIGEIGEAFGLDGLSVVTIQKQLESKLKG